MSKIEDLIYSYYRAAMTDLRINDDVKIMQETIKSYEEAEIYEACEGISRAIADYVFIHNYYKTKESSDKSNLIQISFEKDDDN